MSADLFFCKIICGLSAFQPIWRVKGRKTSVIEVKYYGNNGV